MVAGIISRHSILNTFSQFSKSTCHLSIWGNWTKSASIRFISCLFLTDVRKIKIYFFIHINNKLECKSRLYCNSEKTYSTNHVISDDETRKINYKQSRRKTYGATVLFHGQAFQTFILSWKYLVIFLKALTFA